MDGIGWCEKWEGTSWVLKRTRDRVFRFSTETENRKPIRNSDFDTDENLRTSCNNMYNLNTIARRKIKKRYKVRPRHLPIRA